MSRRRGLRVSTLVDSTFTAEAEVRNRGELFIRQYRTTAALRKVIVLLVVKTSSLFGPRSSAECRIVPTVTGCALIEVGRYLVVVVFALLILDNRSMIIAVGLSLVLMLVRVPQKLELVEDEIRYCATCQS